MIRSTLTALVVAAGMLGLGAAAQAAPAQSSALGASQSPLELAQMSRMERRMVRHRVERRMMKRQMKRRMIRRQVRRNMRGM